MKFKMPLAALVLCSTGLLTLGVAADKTQPATQPAADPMGQGLAKLFASENPAIGSNVEIRLVDPIANGDFGSWGGRLVSINDRWAVVETDHQGKVWLPVPRIGYIRVDAK